MEGPHIYKKDGWYYMVVAEGGTFYGHAATVARSRDIYGPYEMHPNTFLVTTKDAPDSPIQKCGHASWCQGPDGRWFTAFLCSRPYYNKRCVLGRETSINEMVWVNYWPYLKNMTFVPDAEFLFVCLSIAFKFCVRNNGHVFQIRPIVDPDHFVNGSLTP